MEAESNYRSQNSDQGHNFAVLPSTYRLHWYEFESVLGRGGFGITYLARDTNLDHRVAIKEFLPSELAVRTTDRTVHPLSQDHDELFRWGLSRFIEEAQTLARFSHPNIVQVRSVFEANNTAYMVMDYVEGLSFARALRSPRYAGEAELLNILFQLLDGVERIHQAGFIHRDIKPDNIFLQDNGVPVLLDFGSARQSTGAKTRALTALVTPGYAPFEQYDTSSEAERQGPWTDIYALGALLYRIVTGKAPPDAMARMAAQLDGKDVLEPAGQQAGTDYSAPFLRAIDNALQFRPADRPQSIAAWRAQFEFGPENQLPRGRTQRVDDDAPTVLAPTQSAAAPSSELPVEPEPDTVPQTASSAGTQAANTGASSGARSTSTHSTGTGTRARKETETGSTGLDLLDRLNTQETRALPRAPGLARAAAARESEQRPRSPVAILLTGVLAGALLLAGGAGGYWWWQTQSPAQSAGAKPLPATLSYQPIRTPQSFLNPKLVELTALGRDYRAILTLDQDSSAARAGLSDLADSFMALAEFSREHFSVAHAARVTAAGLKTVPEHPGLLAQQNELDAAAVSDEPTAAEQLRIDEWTATARQDLEAMRLTDPPGNNAVTRLKAIASLDPDNTFAAEQLDRLGLFFHDESRAAFIRGDVKTGVQKLEQGLLISPSHQQLLALREAVSARMQKPQ